MSDTWTAITGYATADYADTMVFKVDQGTKKLEKISGQTLVAGEENSQYIRFEMPRYWDGIDIIGKTIKVVHMLTNRYFGETATINGKYSDDMLQFGWVVPKTACCISGTLMFVIVVTGTDYVLKTQIAETPVAKSIDIDGTIPEPSKEAWYREFQARIDSVLQNAEDVAARAAEAAYLARSYVGAPLVANHVADMIDPERIYVYTGSEDGYTAGYWYHYDGSQTPPWVPGGVYNAVAVETDTTLRVAGKAADAEAVGNEIADLKEDLNILRPTATAEDVGKALIVKTVEDGVPTEFEYGDAGGDISAFTDSVKEWLKADDAVGGYWYNSADAPTSTSPTNRCYFDVEIPVTAGTTYYYKDIIGSKSWVKYSGSNARIKNVVNNDLYSGTFVPSADGTVVCSGYLDHKTTAIWTDDESIYTAGLQEDKLILKTDSTLTSETIPANAKATGEAIAGAKAYADSAVASVIDSQANSFFDASYGKCSVNTTAHTVKQSTSGNMHGSGLFRIFPFVTYYTNSTWSIPHCYIYNKDMQFICALGDNTGKVMTVSHVTTKYRMFTVLDPDAYYAILTTAESGWDYDKTFFIKVFSDSDSVVDFGVENSEAVKYRISSVSPYMYGKKWAVLGDSITAGDGLTTNILTRYSSIVAKQCGIIPYNYGYSGSRIAVEGSAGDSTYDNAMVIRYASMIDDADYITVLGGINDANNQLPLGTLGDTDISTFFGALEVLITGLLTKYPGKAIGFITFPHYGGGTGHQTYVDAIKSACVRYAIPVLDLHSMGGMNTMTTAFSQMFYSDGLHPNELGQSVMARKICAFLGTL